jgi:hypothetical protein
MTCQKTKKGIYIRDIPRWHYAKIALSLQIQKHVKKQKKQKTSNTDRQRQKKYKKDKKGKNTTSTLYRGRINFGKEKTR